MPVKNSIAERLDTHTEWRRHLHENPELLFDVYQTAEFVAAKLKEFGCDEVVTGLGKTGVVGVIKGRESASGKAVGLRADMDALPILEETGLDYASKTPGKMHACGHDGHTTMLLSAAEYLASTRNFDGDAVVIFQPAEEGGGGGKVMCDEGMMERFGITEVYGMHNWPGLPVGEFQISAGPVMAAADQFEIAVEGLGAHAAFPHLGIDTTVIGSQIVVSLQTIVSRNVGPLERVVVSVTSFETSTNAHNVIPERVVLKGTVRTLTPEMRDMAETRVGEIAKGTAELMGGKAVVKYERGYPITINHKTETEYAAEVAREISGVCHPGTPTMGGEDFSYMLEERPGAYIQIGNGDSAGLHHPKYNFNDEAIPAGASWLAGMVEARLPVS